MRQKKKTLCDKLLRQSKCRLRKHIPLSPRKSGNKNKEKKLYYETGRSCNYLQTPKRQLRLVSFRRGVVVKPSSSAVDARMKSARFQWEKNVFLK